MNREGKDLKRIPVFGAVRRMCRGGISFVFPTPLGRDTDPLGLGGFTNTLDTLQSNY